MIDVEILLQIIISVLLAVSGGLARVLNSRGKRKLRVGYILSELFISAFAGLMVLLLARSLGLSGDWIGLVCGISGWIGPRILNMLIKPVSKALGLNTDKEQSESSEK